MNNIAPPFCIVFKNELYILLEVRLLLIDKEFAVCTRFFG